MRTRRQLLAAQPECFLALVLLFLAISSVRAESARTPVTSVVELGQRLGEFIRQPQFTHAAWGIKVESLDTGKVLFEHDANKLLIPASNAKLFTGALALDRLGPDYRIRTSCYATRRPGSSGTLRSDLIVYGRGDFSFAARFHEGDYARSLEPLVTALAAVGVKQVKGDLVGDERYFHGPPFGSSWAWDDLQSAFGAEVSALTVEDNAVDLLFRPGRRLGDPCEIAAQPQTSYLRFLNASVTGPRGSRRELKLYRPIGSNVVYVSGQLPVADTNWVDAVSVPKPAMWFLTLLKAKLAQRGIQVSGKLRTIDWLERDPAPPGFPRLMEIAAVESRPMRELVATMMKPSQNQYAQLLLLQVGAVAEERRRRAETGGPRTEDGRQRAEAGSTTTEELGLGELREFLNGAGIGKDEVLLDEGSGVSRSARVTPNAIVDLLKFMSRHRHAGVFRTALPVAGVDGTLRTRMKGTTAERNVTAKTGTLSHVHALSGYVTSAAGERLVFSILLNNFESDSAASARKEIDAIAVMLAELGGRSAAR